MRRRVLEWVLLPVLDAGRVIYVPGLQPSGRLAHGLLSYAMPQIVPEVSATRSGEWNLSGPPGPA